MWIGQCEKTYVWELLVASPIFMKMLNLDFFQTRAPILVLFTLLGLCKLYLHMSYIRYGVYHLVLFILTTNFVHDMDKSVYD
jgi:hypothetical protein